MTKRRHDLSRSASNDGSTDLLTKYVRLKVKSRFHMTLNYIKICTRIVQIASR